MIFSADKTKSLRLELSLLRSGIKLLEEDREDISLEFSELRKKTVAEIFDVVFTENKLSVKEKGWKKLPIPESMFDGEKLNADLVLKLPKETKLTGEIGGVSGKIEADSINFTGKMKSTSGDMTFNNVNSEEISLDNIGGDVSFDYLRGAVKCKTVSGDLSIKNGFLKGFSYKSVSGDLKVTAAFELEKDGQVNTMSGDLNLNVLDYKGDQELKITTLGSHVELEGDYPEDKIVIKKSIPFLTDFPFKSFIPKFKDIMSGFAGACEEPEVEVKTKGDSRDDGNIEKILNMLAEEKITAEEAEKLIKALKK